jgi:ribosome assembly protein RRB1
MGLLKYYLSIETVEKEKRAWFNDGIKEEHLDFDNRAYNMLHRINTEW